MAKEKDRYQVSLKLLLRNNNGEILALKAVDNCSYAGFYDLPGGRIDIGEFEIGLDRILAREVKEELGDVQYELVFKPVAVGRHQLGDGSVRVIYLFFEAKYLNGDIKTSDEHVDHRWLDLKNIELEKYFKSGILEGVKMYLGK